VDVILRTNVQLQHYKIKPPEHPSTKADSKLSGKCRHHKMRVQIYTLSSPTVRETRNYYMFSNNARWRGTTA